MPETKVRSGQLGASLSSKTIDNTNTITMTTAPISGDVLIADYLK